MSFADEASWAVDHFLNFINKREKMSFGGFRRNTVRLKWPTWPPGKQVDSLFTCCFNANWLSKITLKLQAALENGCHSDPHVVNKEDEFQEHSPSEDSVLSAFNWSLVLTTHIFTPEMHILMVSMKPRSYRFNIYAFLIGESVCFILLYIVSKHGA